MLITDRTASHNTKESILLKLVPALSKMLFHSDNKRTSSQHGTRLESIRNMLKPQTFQILSFQLILTGEMLKESISLLSIEIKDIVDLATLFHSRKLLNNG